MYLMCSASISFLTPYSQWETFEFMIKHRICRSRWLNWRLDLLSLLGILLIAIPFYSSRRILQGKLTKSTKSFVAFLKLCCSQLASGAHICESRDNEDRIIFHGKQQISSKIRKSFLQVSSTIFAVWSAKALSISAQSFEKLYLCQA